MVRKRIEELLSELSVGIYEKESELALSMLAALAGESIILLGPPGVYQSRQMNQWYISSKCPVTVLMLMILSRYSR
jgi:MoxR-like ATPase